VPRSAPQGDRSDCRGDLSRTERSAGSHSAKRVERRFDRADPSPPTCSIRKAPRGYEYNPQRRSDRHFEPCEALPNDRAVVTWTQKRCRRGPFGNRNVMAALSQVGRESVDFIRDPSRRGSRSILRMPPARIRVCSLMGTIRASSVSVPSPGSTREIDGSHSAIKARCFNRVWPDQRADLCRSGQSALATRLPP